MFSPKMSPLGFTKRYKTGGQSHFLRPTIEEKTITLGQKLSSSAIDIMTLADGEKKQKLTIPSLEK